jgi:hypothetical protein
VARRPAWVNRNRDIACGFFRKVAGSICQHLPRICPSFLAIKARSPACLATNLAYSERHGSTERTQEQNREN